MKKIEADVYLSNFSLPSYAEIPDVGLYLDQVAKYINNYMKDLPDMEVTPSMISNYAKKKLIQRVNKKTYTQDQIATLFMISLCKTVLSIDQIKILLEEINPDYSSIEDDYTFFSKQLIAAITSQKKASSPSFSSKEELLSTIVIAISQKIHLDNYFQKNS